jgi:hypothetical protein
MFDFLPGIEFLSKLIEFVGEILMRDLSPNSCIAYSLLFVDFACDNAWNIANGYNFCIILRGLRLGEDTDGSKLCTYLIHCL